MGARTGFIGIGAQKCATTWLHDVLVDHPQIAMPTHRKEVDFFSYHYDFGFEWYERKFQADEATLLCGEISPSYLHGPGLPERVADYNPAMKIVMIVRDPIARAVSNHKHEVRTGHLQGEDLSFEYGLRNNPSYIEQGLYAKHLARWLAVFPPEQVLLLKFEEVVTDAAATLRLVTGFLGVDPDYQSPMLHNKSNESYLSRSSRVDALKDKAKALLRAMRLGGLWKLLGDTGLREQYRRLNRVKPERTIGKPLPETITYLKAVFAADVEQLQQMSDLSLSDWLK